MGIKARRSRCHRQCAGDGHSLIRGNAAWLWQINSEEETLMHLPGAFDIGTRLGTLENSATVKIALLRYTRGGWVRVRYGSISHTHSAATPRTKGS
jgi:hypothetical protein